MMKSKLSHISPVLPLLLLVVLSFILVFHCCTATTTIINNESESDDESTKYHVVLRESIDEMIASKQQYDPKQSMPMTIRGEVYKCYFPARMNKKSTNTNHNNSADTKQQEISQFLKDFNKKCFFRIAGWWIYEYCFNSHVRQYHQDAKGEVTMDYSLGLSADKDRTEQSFTVQMSHTNPEDSYISYQFSGGSECDLTGNNRVTETRIYCATDEKKQQLLNNPGYSNQKNLNFIGDIEEPASCSYLLKFYSTQLCDLDGFSKDEEVLHKVQCVPIDKAMEYEKSLQQEVTSNGEAEKFNH